MLDKDAMGFWMACKGSVCASPALLDAWSPEDTTLGVYVKSAAIRMVNERSSVRHFALRMF